MTTDHGPRYTAIAAHLPPLYRQDRASAAEIDGYLGGLDDHLRQITALLDEVTTWLSPAATTMWPPAYMPGDSAEDATGEYLAVLDELASWFSFEPPLRWGRDLAVRRDFLLRAARLFRRRGTPAGFVDWFCFYFQITDPAERPTLVEHFKYRENADPDENADSDEDAHRVTIFVPLGARIETVADRDAVNRFVERNLPAHLVPRVCWVNPGFGFPQPDGEDAWAAHVAALAAAGTWQDLLPALAAPAPLPDWSGYAASAREDDLCGAVDVVQHPIHLEPDPEIVPPDTDAPGWRSTDELGLGRLDDPGA